MPFSNDLSVRKHAQNFLRQLDVKHLEDYKVGSQKFSTLCAVRKDARLTATSILDKVKDGMPEDRAAELEAAHDGVSQFLAAIEAELDFRNENGGDRDQGSNSIDYSKRPQFEDRVSPAVDGGYCSPVEDSAAYSLRSSDTYRAWAQPRVTEQYNGLTLGNYFRSMISGCQNEQEQRALSEGTNSAGGFTVPEVLSATLIDKLRAQSVAIQAGCRTIPMSSDNLSIAKVAADPSPAFRNEAAAITETDPTFSIVQMEPKMLAMMTKVSVEVMADTVNLQTELPNIIARAMAAEMDRVVFQGTGSAPEPRGITSGNRQILTFQICWIGGVIYVHCCHVCCILSGD